MSKFEIKMPKLGESITEGTIVSWSVKVGDMIQEDDVLFEVNTAKVSAEIPSGRVVTEEQSADDRHQNDGEEVGAAAGLLV